MVRCRRDHGAERAHLGLFDAGRNGVANCQVRPRCCATRHSRRAPAQHQGAARGSMPLLVRSRA